MARTTIADVKLILDNTTLPDSVITAFIKSANIFVTNALGSSALDNDTLQDIECWITAHLISFTLERQSKKESAGSASVEYAGKFDGIGLKGTSYGQMAISLDTTGILETVSGGNQSITMEAL